tara:strand:- start:8104 stop:8463 length:360 start_codon:yes stop_codon:yes gene_type:complete
MTKSIESLMDRLDKKEKKILKFSDLLDSLESTEERKKLLWKEIYENSLNDRESANILFTDLLIESKGNSAQHAIFGPIMSKYLERMCKSNDQILRLAELISKEEEKAVDVDAIFDKIGA